MWAEAPDSITRTWLSAISICANKTVGGAVGWRLLSLSLPFVPASAFTVGQLFGYRPATLSQRSKPCVVRAFHP
jgi:hypothetical protein